MILVFGPNLVIPIDPVLLRVTNSGAHLSSQLVPELHATGRSPWALRDYRPELLYPFAAASDSLKVR